MIADCFPFFNEFDLLDIRLNYLKPHVDRFVLCESPLTFSGKPKPLWFDEAKERYRNYNIIHVIADHGTSEPSNEHNEVYNSESWRREIHQRNFLEQGIKDLGPEDFIMLSDVDEIPDMESWTGEEGVFRQQFFYYFFNFMVESGWSGTRIIKKKNFQTMWKMRYRRGRNKRVGMGWHFSYMASPDEIRRKIEAFSHQELNTDSIKGRIAENVASLADLFGRDKMRFHKEMPSGPKWLLDNKERYPHLWLEI